jgi:hypothetical protein
MSSVERMKYILSIKEDISQTRSCRIVIFELGNPDDPSICDLYLPTNIIEFNNDEESNLLKIMDLHLVNDSHVIENSENFLMPIFFITQTCTLYKGLLPNPQEPMNYDGNYIYFAFVKEM